LDFKILEHAKVLKFRYSSSLLHRTKFHQHHIIFQHNMAT